MSYAPPSADRPVPHPTELSAPHWDGARAGRLMVQRCEACRRYVFTPRHVCPGCLGDTLAWVESSGLGQVYSYTVIHRPPHPAFQPPYCAAIVELDEGWRMVTNIVGLAPEAVRVGLAVQVDFLEVGEAVLPVFRPRPPPSD